MDIRQRIFEIENEDDFGQVALDVFRFQAEHSSVYKQYISYLGLSAGDVTHYRDIPFLPIQFFKTQEVIVSDHDTELSFHSSGTTGMQASRHLVHDLSWYEESYRKAFELFYGDVSGMAILALLPSYLEREGSSLIYMIDDLIQQSQQPESDYFLYDHQRLYDTLIQLRQKKTRTVLIGVTYALLDFVEVYQLDFPELIVMETGGMKGKRKEMVREELHTILKSGFGVPSIHSEYGMTELLSQGYSYGNGIFHTPPWMQILIRDTNDPLTILDDAKTGAINVIDLANYYSCSFIATQDLGKYHEDGGFEVLGRFDNADIRGCNLLVQ
jgi:hypothetical protein